MSDVKMLVSKVTLSSKKVVYLREPKIRDSDMAAQVAAPKSNGDVNLLQFLAQKELIKQLIVGIDEKKVSPKDLEDLDSVFSVREFSELIQVAKKVMGDDEMGKDPTVESVSFGLK